MFFFMEGGEKRESRGVDILGAVVSEVKRSRKKVRAFRKLSYLVRIVVILFSFSI